MQIYHYHHVTGEFLGEGVADESPLEPGVFIIPAHATTIQPLEYREGMTRCFIDGKWQYVPASVLETSPEETPSEPTQEDILKTMRDAIQNYLDAKPQERLYDGILSLCTYATSTNPKFAAEGQAGVVWRDACWAKGYEIMVGVQAGTRPIPTVDELLSELPVFHWPDEVAP